MKPARWKTFLIVKETEWINKQISLLNISRYIDEKNREAVLFQSNFCEISWLCELKALIGGVEEGFNEAKTSKLPQGTSRTDIKSISQILNS